MNQFGLCDCEGESHYAPAVEQKAVGLSGVVNWVSLGTQTRGVYRITVTCLLSGGPCLSFELSRTDPTLEYNPGHSFASPAADGNAIGFRWPASGSIQLSKSMASYDTTYYVTLYR
jgi:hypothetical protein